VRLLVLYLEVSDTEYAQVGKLLLIAISGLLLLATEQVIQLGAILTITDVELTPVLATLFLDRELVDTVPGTSKIQTLHFGIDSNETKTSNYY
jgi:hypothetical protein